ncbi:hypothetical protein [Pantoea agglomerans]|uniref:hypothetical protein n=1 Tax=Enterobacter agglomerans TaxID=549 RepID=UPI0021D7C754|nr:hypothetical protein [Pantoea agglomerans]
MRSLSMSPAVARASLASKFSSHLKAISIFNTMQDSQVVVLSSLLDSHHLTSSGNSVKADFEVTRLPAIIEMLEKKYFFPIRHLNVSVRSVTTGRMTVQTVYLIEPEHIEQLLADPEVVFANQERSLFFRSLEKEGKNLGKLIEKKGSVSQAVLSLLHHAYKDKPLSDEMWQEVEEKFTHMLDELSAA